MGQFRMPSLGADMDRGTLVEWRVRVGDHVDRGDIVAVVDTDKAVIDVEVFETGVVEELLVEPGTNVPVGTPLARLRADEVSGAAVPPTAPAALPTVLPAAPAAPAPPTVPPAAPAAAAPPVVTDRPANAAPPWTAPPPGVRVPGGPGRHHASVVLSPVVRHLADRLGVDATNVEGTGIGHRVTRADIERAAGTRVGRASPRARRRAAERGVDLAAVTGTGTDGAVHERDVLLVAATTTVPVTPAPTPAATPRAPATTGTDRQSSSRRATARSMERSNREIPHYHLATTVDMEPALAWLQTRNDGRPPSDRVIPAALLLRATALAARAVPDLNGWWIDGDLRTADRVDLGVAVALRGGGLVTPTLPGADVGPVEDLMTALRDVVERARRGSLRSSDLAEASITVTNLGERGAELVHGVIHPPQVALVGFGRIAERPWVLDGRVLARHVVTATLAADHRASDGHVGSRFLAAVDRLLHDPDRLAGTDRAHDDDRGETHGS